jgi:hypothetical protein
MVNAFDLLKQAAGCRDLAKLARRLAGTLLDGPDRDRLLRYGEEVEEHAAGLEKQAAALAPATQTVGLGTPPTTPELPAKSPVDPEEKPKR